MAIEVGIAELKARLSHYLRLVRDGQEVVIKDRETPVARLVPHSGTAEPALRIWPATLSLSDLNKLKPKRLKNLTPGVALKILAEMRRDRVNDLVDEWTANTRASVRR